MSATKNKENASKMSVSKHIKEDNSQEADFFELIGGYKECEKRSYDYEEVKTQIDKVNSEEMKRMSEEREKDQEARPNMDLE